MDDLIFEPNLYGLCTNPECGAAFEFSEVGPFFCSRCKHPLFTHCLHCGAPFLYRPEKFCGLCSGDLAFGKHAQLWLMLYVYKRLRQSGAHPDPGLDSLLNYSDGRSIKIERFFPCLMLPGDIREMFESRGLGGLLIPTASTRKNLLRLVKK